MLITAPREVGPRLKAGFWFWGNFRPLDYGTAPFPCAHRLSPGYSFLRLRCQNHYFIAYGAAPHALQNYPVPLLRCARCWCCAVRRAGAGTWACACALTSCCPAPAAPMHPMTGQRHLRTNLHAAPTALRKFLAATNFLEYYRSYNIISAAKAHACPCYGTLPRFHKPNKPLPWCLSSAQRALLSHLWQPALAPCSHLAHQRASNAGTRARRMSDMGGTL